MLRFTQHFTDWSRWGVRSEYSPVVFEESSMNEQSSKLTGRYLALQTRHRKLQRWSTILSMLFGLALLGLLVVYWNAAVIADEKERLSPVPPLLLTTVKFERDNRYAGPSTQETDQAWGALMPPGDGFIFVNDSASYNLEPGMQSADREVYDVSLFHQLHCLAHIRMYAFTLKAAVHRHKPQDIYDRLLRKGEDHVYHCFDYIRQAIMCAGDMTVEWPRVEADGRRFAVDGWGITHKCRSWDAIMDFMMENTVANGW